MWDNLLIVSSPDNGGPVYNNGSAGGNNYPLRGGKMSNWQGGVRVNGWVGGGFVPEAVRGTVNNGYITLWDWYSTFCALAGVDPTDHRAEQAGLPPIDSFNMWPMLSGQNSTSPRTEIPLGHVGSIDLPLAADANTTVQGLIQGDWKLLIGNVYQSIWQGPLYPNASTAWQDKPFACGDPVDGSGPGCLFNIADDPTEHNDLASSMPEKVKDLRARITEIQASVYSPDRGQYAPRACQVATHRYEGFYGPFVDIN